VFTDHGYLAFGLVCTSTPTTVLTSLYIFLCLCLSTALALCTYPRMIRTPRASSPCYMGGHARPSFPHFSGPSPDRTCSAVLGGAGRSGSLLLPAALCIAKVARTLIQLLCAFSVAFPPDLWAAPPDLSFSPEADGIVPVTAIIRRGP